MARRLDDNICTIVGTFTGSCLCVGIRWMAFDPLQDGETLLRLRRPQELGCLADLLCDEMLIADMAMCLHQNQFAFTQTISTLHNTGTDSETLWYFNYL